MLFFRRVIVIITGLLMIWIVNCGGEGNMENLLDNNLGAEIRRNSAELNRLRILFGHQSVGFNILHGLESMEGIFEEITWSFPDLSGNSRDRVEHGEFAHFVCGANGNPRGKIDHFAQMVRQYGDSLDFAFLKLCYADFKPPLTMADVEEIFRYYQSTMQQLQEEFPHLKILHFTSPLTINPKRFRLFEFPSEANILRNHYSRLIRENFPPDRIVDIARIESTRPDGSRELFEKDGVQYEKLYRAYGSDGKHLNHTGSILVGQELLKTIMKNCKE